MDNNPPSTPEPIQQPNSNPVSVPPTPMMPSSQEPEKNLPADRQGHKMLYILLAGIVIILLTGGAFYLGRSAALKPQSPPPQACTEEAMVCPDGSAVGRTGPNCEFAACPSANKSDDRREPNGSAETANWKTYTNSKCGYQLKYPQSWSISPESEKDTIGATTIFPYEIGSGIKIPPEWFKVQIGCADKQSETSLKELVKKLNARDSGYGVPAVEKQEEINLNGSPAIKQIIVPPVGEKVLEYYIFPTGNKYYAFGFTPAGTTSENLIYQILSTFKFTQ